MRLAIFGVQRSGTSLLYQILKPYYTYSLNEAFIPVSHYTLIERNDRLFNKQNKTADTGIVTQDRNAKLELVQKYPHHEYLIKVFPYDVNHPGIADWLTRMDYRIIAIERKRPIDAVISAVIAYDTQVWQVENHKSVPPINHTISFTEQLANYMFDCYRLYYEILIKYPYIHKIVYYEDLSKMNTRNQILQAMNLETVLDLDMNNDSVLPLKKPRSESEKRRLISNMPELVNWYKSKMLPMLPEHAKQFDLTEYET